MSRQESAREAAIIARQEVLDACASNGLTILALVKGIKAGLRAKETKATYDKDTGEWAYSKAMISWAARQKAIDQGISLLGIKAPDKHDLTTGGHPIDFNTISIEEREAILEASRAIQAVKDGKP